MFQTNEDSGPAKGGLLGVLATFADKWGAREPLLSLPKGYQPRPRPAAGTWTAAQVAEHCTPGDAWLIIDNKVYDISAWGGLHHPGGEIIYSYAGRDATEPFVALHKNQKATRAILKAFCIGDLKASPADTPALLQDFKRLRQQFETEGLMSASAVFYTRKLLELAAMVSTSLYLLWSGAAEASILWLLLASVLMATFIFQCGWTGHDFLHNQVFTDCRYNTLVGGFIANVCVGSSTHWWKTKHNTHHATPNKTTADSALAMDPDIDTVPLVAWSADLSRQVPAAERSFIRVQHVLIWPLLAVAYINWVIQGKIHLLSYPRVATRQKRIELLGIALHHLWLQGSIFACLSLPNALAFWLVSHCLSGFGTAFVFIQSHNGMEIYSDDKDFVTSQIVSTRNINPGLVSDWIMGGLNYQIEHHLFPTMPRHSYSRIRTRVMEFCARHGLPYESCSIGESTTKVYRQLQSVARATAQM